MDKVVAIIFLVYLLTGCTYDNEEEFYGDICDTTNVSYSQTVKPILNINCVGCHSSVFNNGGVILESYGNVKALADNGSLLGVIEHKPGYTPMPLNGQKLDDCSIEKIKKWISEEAQNN